MSAYLRQLANAYHKGQTTGICSVCSSHALVIEAALKMALETEQRVLIEATCNQVNQDGGYTGMTPADFRRYVKAIAGKVGLPSEYILYGGDHLGPNPWKHLPAEQAMQKAEALIAAYAEAGFTKLHLDTSMGCAGEPQALADEETARRAAKLADIAEQSGNCDELVYVIGTEVPVPGGANHTLESLALTEPDAVAKTYEVHRQAFAARDLYSAFERVIGLVVQPGVEFGHTDIVHFDPARAVSLSEALQDFPGLVYEAHSTDYQRAESLRALVSMGFTILKVGPWLTFALREALYRLDAIACILESRVPDGQLMSTMEDVMLDDPANWKNYYTGDEQAQWLQRHFSLSDRIRYYWPNQAACDAVDRLMARLGEQDIPAPLLHQYFPEFGLREQALDASAVLYEAVARVLRQYQNAVSV